MNRVGEVYYQGQLSGIISEDEDGYAFTYEVGYLENNYPTVSLTLPLREASYRSKILFPFFDRLIPKGWLLDIAI